MPASKKSAKKSTSKKAPKKSRTVLHALARIAILVGVASVILGIGMSQFKWKPFGVTWDRVAGQSAKGADGITKDIGDAVEGMGQRAKDSLDGAREKIEALTEREPEPKEEEGDALTDEDRAARDALLREKGL